MFKAVKEYWDCLARHGLTEDHKTYLLLEELDGILCNIDQDFLIFHNILEQLSEDAISKRHTRWGLVKNRTPGNQCDAEIINLKTGA
jgi:hypothetical protein